MFILVRKCMETEIHPIQEFLIIKKTKSLNTYFKSYFISANLSVCAGMDIQATHIPKRLPESQEINKFLKYLVCIEFINV